jgi:hypothetical protein
MRSEPCVHHGGTGQHDAAAGKLRRSEGFLHYDTEVREPARPGPTYFINGDEVSV